MFSVGKLVPKKTKWGEGESEKINKKGGREKKGIII
jgi:hypothetical protein